MPHTFEYTSSNGLGKRFIRDVSIVSHVNFTRSSVPEGVGIIDVFYKIAGLNPVQLVGTNEHLEKTYERLVLSLKDS